MKAFLKSKGFTLVELMIVIVIVGILAAVAIPKFTRAADKARASEFPTVLTGIYTQEEAYHGETGTYNTSFATIDMTDPSSGSRWFTYDVPTGNASTFLARARVSSPFGKCTNSETATIDDSNQKAASGELANYVTTWR